MISSSLKSLYSADIHQFGGGFLDNYEREISDIKNVNLTPEKIQEIYDDASNVLIQILCMLHPNSSLTSTVSIYNISHAYRYENKIERKNAPWFFGQLDKYKVNDGIFHNPVDQVVSAGIINKGDQSIIERPERHIPYRIYALLFQIGWELNLTNVREYLSWRKDRNAYTNEQNRRDHADYDGSKTVGHTVNYYLEIHPEIDPRLLDVSNRNTIKNIDAIFAKKHIDNSDIKFLESVQYLNVEGQTGRILEYLKDLSINKNDSFSSVDDSFVDINNALTMNDLKIEGEPYIDEKGNLMYNISTSKGNFVLTKNVYDYLMSNHIHDAFYLSPNMVILTKIYQERYWTGINKLSVYDENLNLINENMTKKSGMYIYMITTHRAKEEGGNDVVIFRTGESRNLIPKTAKNQLNNIVKESKNVKNKAGILKNIINNIPPKERQKERTDYIHRNLYRSSIFQGMLADYGKMLLSGIGASSYPDTIRRNDEFKQYLLPLFEELYMTLTNEEFDFIARPKSISNDESKIVSNDENNVIVTRSGLVSENLIKEIYTKEKSKNRSISNRMEAMFSDIVGASDDFKREISSDIVSVKTSASEIGRDIFNEGLQSGAIQQKRISSYPIVAEIALETIIPHFTDPESYDMKTSQQLMTKIEEVPIFVVKKNWMDAQMASRGTDRMFYDSTTDDYKGVFVSYLNMVNGGKPFIVINDYEEKDLKNMPFEIAKKILSVEGSDASEDTVLHEIVHALSFVNFESRRKGNPFDLSYSEDPWSQRPEEIRSIVFGNIGYISKTVFRNIADKMGSQDESTIDALVVELVDETKKIEYYQLDQIYTGGEIDKMQELFESGKIDKKAYDRDRKEIQKRLEDMEIILSQEIKEDLMNETNYNMPSIAVTQNDPGYQEAIQNIRKLLREGVNDPYQRIKYQMQLSGSQPITLNQDDHGYQEAWDKQNPNKPYEEAYSEILNQNQESISLEKARNITDNIVEFITTNWLSQFVEDKDSLVKSSYERAIELKNLTEKLRHEELMYADVDEYKQKSKTQYIQEPDKEEKEFIDKIRSDSDYVDYASTLSAYYNEKLKNEPDENRRRSLSNVIFFSNGYLKIPSSMQGIISYIDSTTESIISDENKYLFYYYPVIEKGRKLKEKVQALYKEFSEKQNIYNDQYNAPTLPTTSDEMEDLAKMLVQMTSEYGPGWMDVAKKNKPEIRIYSTTLLNLNKYCSKTIDMLGV